MERFAIAPDKLSIAHFRLPTAGTPIIGRTRERVQIGGLFHDGARLVTLSGTGGVGKTRLALAVADELRPMFDDRVGWISLGELTNPELLLDTIARQLDIIVHERDPFEALAAGIGDRPAFLVVDNMEHLVEQSGVLGELIERMPALSMLATSRLPLRLTVEREMRIDPFPAVAERERDDLIAHPAVQLFIERARAVDVSFNPTDQELHIIAAIVGRLDFLPLAIELAAARVRHFSLDEILDLLDTDLDVLTGGPRDVPDRHRTMRNTIEWSYLLLAPTEQRMLRMLAVFPGAFTLDNVFRLGLSAGFTRVDIIETISALVDQNLLTRLDEAGAARYTILGAIRSYGRSQLRALGEDVEIRSRFAQSVIERVERVHPEITADISQFETIEQSMDDIRAAIDWSIAAGDSVLALRLISALAGWWEVRGNPREGAGLYDQAFAIADEIPDRVHFEAVRNYAWLLTLSGQSERGLALRPEIEALAETIDDMPIRLQAKKVLGVLACIEGDIDSGRCAMQEALDIAENAGFDRAIPGLVVNLAALAELAGDFENALALRRRGLTTLDRKQFPGFYAIHQVGIASIFAQTGKLRSADQLIREIWSEVSVLRMTDLLAEIFMIKGDLLIATGDPEQAARLLGAGKQIAERSGRVFTESERAQIDRSLHQLSESMSPDVLAAALATGQTMPIDELGIIMEQPIATTSSPEPSHPSLLTPRETEVAHLLVQGKTNPEIANVLFISERTVQSHIANIMGKLGVNSRTAAAAQLVRMHMSGTQNG